MSEARRHATETSFPIHKGAMLLEFDKDFTAFNATKHCGGRLKPSAQELNGDVGTSADEHH
ncbi:hypothetical protein KIN20_008895 [Parelaphostrongylus tenuis]|uniref:Uncharacterized protein n=1 Tax=Parelaphostrongylus tenuis TaxID=148309 RepID=A0AAD5QMZ1_PARTN|nr:hypothetical protein KIN20_008895 [Parelaphostrongylus tenuis]